MKWIKLALAISVLFMFTQEAAFPNAFQWDSGYKSDAPDADEIDVDVTSLAGALSTADTNVQLALDTLDDAVQTTTDALVGTSLTATGAGQSTIGDLIVGDSVSLDSTGGKLTIEGEGGSNDENLTIDFEGTENVIGFDSTTGITRWGLDVDLRFSDDVGTQWGSGGDWKTAWETEGNDNAQIGVRVNGVDKSGYISIMEGQDMGDVDRSPLGTSADPVLRIYSSDATVATDYIEFFHDQAIATIRSGDGVVSFENDVIKTTYYMTTGYYTTLDFPGSGAPVGSIITIGGPEGNCGGVLDGTTVNVCVSDGSNWIAV